MQFRPREWNPSDVAEITLMSPGDILVLYTDGVYDGSDDEVRKQLELILGEHEMQSAKAICGALLDYAARQDDRLRQNGDEELIDIHH